MSVSLDKTPKPAKRFVAEYDLYWGSWGTVDTHSGTPKLFVGHTGTEAGARVQARKMNQDPTR